MFTTHFSRSGGVGVLAILVGLGAARPQQTPAPGELGYQPPEVADVRVPDTVVHQDSSGGSLQTLQGLAGSPAGFAAVWRDTRDGSLGLYFARLDADLAPIQPERSICQPHTMRRTDAVVALGTTGRGAVAWTSVIGRGSVPFVHAFDAAGFPQGGERMISSPVLPTEGQPARGGRGDDDASCREPALAVLSDGRLVLAWARGGRVQWLTTSPSGDPLAPATELDATLPAARGSVRLGVGPADVVACAFEDGAGEACLTLKQESRSVTRALGHGRPVAVVPAAEAGYWCLLADEERSRVVRLGANGDVLRTVPSPSGAVVRRSALAALPGGFALLEEPVQEGEAVGSMKVWLLDDDGGVRSGSPILVAGPDARVAGDGTLASAGTKLCIAWTDTRNGDPDVYARLLDTAARPEPALGPERRVNTDVASANQLHPAVAGADDQGAIVWIDERAAPTRAYVRHFGPDGLAGPELALPLAHGEEAPALPPGLPQRPAVAVSGGGDVLVAWRLVLGPGRARLVAQLLDPGGGARTGLLELDDGVEAALGDPACAPLPHGHGFAVAWARGGRSGVRARLVGPDGELGPPREVAAPGEDDARTLSASDVDLTVLESGRTFCAWTLSRPADTWVLRGRFLSDALVPLGGEIAFEPTARNEDWDPALAPAVGGGFVMSWTSGSVRDPVRDVVVRAFDGRARPSGPLHTVCYSANEQDFSDVARLADGSFAVAWEDDISYFDQVYVRRLSRDGRTLGPMMRINSTETSFLPDRVAPRLAPLGSGFAAVFSDRHRGRGFDVVFKLVGAAFDRPAGTSGGRR